MGSDLTSSPIMHDVLARKLEDALCALLLANAGFSFLAGEVGRLELLAADADGLDHAIGRLVSIVFSAQESGPGPALRPAPSANWRSTTAPRTARPPGAAPGAALGCALDGTGDGTAKTLRSVVQRTRLQDGAVNKD